jgi:hypothetical protein
VSKRPATLYGSLAADCPAAINGMNNSGNDSNKRRMDAKTPAIPLNRERSRPLPETIWGSRYHILLFTNTQMPPLE